MYNFSSALFTTALLMMIFELINRRPAKARGMFLICLGAFALGTVFYPEMSRPSLPEAIAGISAGVLLVSLGILAYIPRHWRGARRAREQNSGAPQ